MKFTHLHTHSHYSLLQALPKIPELVEAAKSNGMEALALTDNGNLYGAIEFYKECKKAGIKPIIGVDAYLAGRTRRDKQTGVDKERYRLVLLAKDETGYKNLLKLVTVSYLEGFYYKPRIDFEVLEKHSEGLIAVSSSWSGDISTFLRGGNKEKLKEALDFYKRIFKENFYIEITKHPEIQGHNEHMHSLVKFAKENDIPAIASHNVYYINLEDRDAKDTLMAVMQGGEPKERSWDDGDENLSFLSQEEANERFRGEEELLFNNQKVASLCNLELELGRWVFPDYKTELGITHDEELRKITYEGLEKRGLESTPEFLERIEYELKVIRDKGYAPYFLVVGDLLRYAKNNGIVTTTRGSAGGSMVSYLNYITTLNPIEYELPFERFLNPERPSPPDIDMDIADDKRDQMIEYVKQKYGSNKVAQIGTFGTMMARGSVRDTARALGFAYTVGDRIAKLIPMGAQGFPMTIDRAMEETPELKELYKKDLDTQKIINMARKIEGCARHISIHAAGVVIAPSDIMDFTALQYDPKGENKIITQFDMHSVEDAGLLKFDFLGLKNLSIISKTVELVKRMKNIIIDIDKIPIDNKKTFEMLARGETEDLFQLNGDGMTKWLVELKPTVIHDLSVMVALYRPGPMDNINAYIARKNGTEKTTYLHPKMENFLSKTYGVLVYQDDLLMSAIELAGYSWGEVDKFRKAVGKKIPEEMAKQHIKFVEGCIEHSGMKKELAERIWKLFEPFQGYGFNKAHAASYGRVAYQTAYLKANFPGEYMRAVLSSESGETEKVAVSVAECKRMGLPVLPPDINESFSDFTLVPGSSPGTIRFGLSTIKNFGEGIAATITAERKDPPAGGGPFKNLEDFLSRIHDRNLNKKSLEALIKSGCFDKFGERGQMLANMDILLEYNKESVSNGDQNSLFSGISSHASLRLKETPPASSAEKLAWEKELLGLYVSGHPLDQFREKFKSQKSNLKIIKENGKEGEVVVIGGLIEELRPVITKSGEKMAFIKLVDPFDSIEAVVFPRTLSEFISILNPEECIAVKARLSLRNGEKSLIVEKVKRL